MTEWAQELKREQEFATDEMLEQLISLRQLEDQVQESLFTGAVADAPMTDAHVLMHVRFLETQLDAWKRDNEGDPSQRRKSMIHFKAIRLTLH